MKKYLKGLIIFLIFVNVPLWQNNIILLQGNDRLEIFFLDVGQGDAILIKTPDNTYGLIDGGKGDVVLEKISEVLPLGKRSLEFVVFTHPDADHIEGLVEILERYSVKNVFIAKTNKNSELYNQAKDIIAEKNITNFELRDVNDFKINDVFFDVIWPLEATDVYSAEDFNETSTSMIITYKDFSFFTAGDLGIENEDQAITLAEFNDIDLLKLSHHGSKNSSSVELLKKVDPKVSVISAGKSNSYGHPATEVLDRLNHINTVTLRTDESGTIKISTDGYKMEIPDKKIIDV